MLGSGKVGRASVVIRLGIELWFTDRMDAAEKTGDISKTFSGVVSEQTWSQEILRANLEGMEGLTAGFPEESWFHASCS